MRFTLNIDHENRLVRITHHTNLTLDDMTNARQQAGQMMQAEGLFRLLIDVRAITSPPDTLDNFEIATSHHTALPSHVRMGILVPVHLVADAQFAENTSVNRGVNVRVFTDETVALAWLLQT